MFIVKNIFFLAKKTFLKKQMAKISPPPESRTCSLQYDGNADCFPRIVEHILQSKRIPPKYLGFSPRFMVNKFYIINRKSNFLRMEIFLRLFHFCSHSRQKEEEEVYATIIFLKESHTSIRSIRSFVASFTPSLITLPHGPQKVPKLNKFLSNNQGLKN